MIQLFDLETDGRDDAEGVRGAAAFPGVADFHCGDGDRVGPFAEEYLFRGLLFRALDSEWGWWKAVAGSAALFAIYHQPLVWPMVFSLGALDAVLFRKTRRLAPAVVLHIAFTCRTAVDTPKVSTHTESGMPWRNAAGS